MFVIMCKSNTGKQRSNTSNNSVDRTQNTTLPFSSHNFHFAVGERGEIEWKRSRGIEKENI